MTLIISNYPVTFRLCTYLCNCRRFFFFVFVLKRWMEIFYAFVFCMTCHSLNMIAILRNDCTFHYFRSVPGEWYPTFPIFHVVKPQECGYRLHDYKIILLDSQYTIQYTYQDHLWNCSWVVFWVIPKMVFNEQANGCRKKNGE